MIQITITVTKKGARIESAKAIAERVATQIQAEMGEKWPDALIGVRRYERPESRADRFAECISKVEDAASEAESLRDELQDWKDNLPENLQSSPKADELDDAISQLDEFIDAAGQAAYISVDFPSMF